MPDSDILIVGGGLAGLSSAVRLHEAGVAVQLLEASVDVGGRARTDEMDGFLLDRGFQTLLTAYPEARRMLDYDALKLAPFEPGALIRFQGRFHRLVDPWRQPRSVFATATSPIGTLGDKLRVGRLRIRVRRGTLEELCNRPERTTIDLLRTEGFSEGFVDRFFRPFLGGVFLDRELETSSRMFDFVFRMFAAGDAALPARGMGAIAKQLAARLPAECVRTNTRVDAIGGGSVQLAGGEKRRAKAVVVACEAPAAARLIGESTAKPLREAWRAVTCLYYTADRPLVEEPILVLNGDGEGPINNLCVPSQVATSYAPAGKSLVSVSVLGSTNEANGRLEKSVRGQLREWFGTTVDHWRHLRTYAIPFALPSQPPTSLSPVAKPPRYGDDVYLCGDYCDTASIQGAMASGRRAAEAVLEDL